MLSGIKRSLSYRSFKYNMQINAIFLVLIMLADYFYTLHWPLFEIAIYFVFVSVIQFIIYKLIRRREKRKLFDTKTKTIYALTTFINIVFLVLFIGIVTFIKNN